MPLHQVGDMIERQIENMWFGAIIESVNLTRRMLKVRYLDDGNIEDGVPMSECRRVNEGGGEDGEGKHDGNYESKGIESKWESKHSEKHEGDTKGSCVAIKDTLLKPLAGLIEDDELDDLLGQQRGALLRARPLRFTRGPLHQTASEEP